MSAKTVGITVHIEPEKRKQFNEYARKIGISPGNLIRNFIYTTIASQSPIASQPTQETSANGN